MMFAMSQPEEDRTAEHRELPNLGDESGDRDSITDVHGTVARFEMAYSPDPGTRHAFGPPLSVKLPSFLYLGVAVVAAVLVVIAYTSSSASTLFRYIVEGDKHRILSAPGFALILVASSIGSVVRTHMRGVVVTSDGLETRTLITLGLPRVRKWAWPQVDRILVDDGNNVLIELWDGRYERLPDVDRRQHLAELMQQVAAARRIQVTRLKDLARS